MAMSYAAAATSTWWCPGPSGGSRGHLIFPVAKNEHLERPLQPKECQDCAGAGCAVAGGAVRVRAIGGARALCRWFVDLVATVLAVPVCAGHYLGRDASCPAAPARRDAASHLANRPRRRQPRGDTVLARHRSCGAAVLYLPGGDTWRRKRRFTLRLMVPRDLRGKV